MRELWNLVDMAIRFVVATVLLAAAIAVPAFFRHAEGNAALAVDLMGRS